MLSSGPRYHFKLIMCVWSLSPLLLLKQHYWGCRINSLNPPMPSLSLSYIHTVLVKGRPESVFGPRLTPCWVCSSCHTLYHSTRVLSVGSAMLMCQWPETVMWESAFWSLVWSIVVFNEWLMISNSFNSFLLQLNALCPSGGDNMPTC